MERISSEIRKLAMNIEAALEHSMFDALNKFVAKPAEDTLKVIRDLDFQKSMGATIKARESMLASQASPSIKDICNKSLQSIKASFKSFLEHKEPPARGEAIDYKEAAKDIQNFLTQVSFFDKTADSPMGKGKALPFYHPS